MVGFLRLSPRKKKRGRPLAGHGPVEAKPRSDHAVVRVAGAKAPCVADPTGCRDANQDPNLGERGPSRKETTRPRVIYGTAVTTRL